MQRNKRLQGRIRNGRKAFGMFSSKTMNVSVESGSPEASTCNAMYREASNKSQNKRWMPSGSKIVSQ